MECHAIYSHYLCDRVDVLATPVLDQLKIRFWVLDGSPYKNVGQVGTLLCLKAVRIQ